MVILTKKIILLATGGTIASTGERGKRNLIATLKGEKLLDELPILSQLNEEIEVINFSTVNSTNMTPDKMVELATKINELLAQEDVMSIIVTHGTSLLEETSFVLDLLVTGSKPVIITGAQRAASSTWPDGKSNLNDALCVATSPLSRGMGVMVVFDGKIHEAKKVTKVHTSALDAFSSGEEGLLGSVYFNTVTFFHSRVRKTLTLNGFEYCTVGIIPFYSGADDRYFRSAIETGECGLIVEGVGLGNVNKSYYDGIMAACEHGIKVIVTTRCIHGHIVPMYSYTGGGASLREQGVLLSSLSSPKARLLLILALGGKLELDKLTAFLD